MTPTIRTGGEGGVRDLSSFTLGEREVIAERHHGWESASIALLALVFGAHVNTIAAICREHGRSA